MNLKNKKTIEWINQSKSQFPIHVESIIIFSGIDRSSSLRCSLLRSHHITSEKSIVTTSFSSKDFGSNRIAVAYSSKLFDQLFNKELLTNSPTPSLVEVWKGQSLWSLGRRIRNEEERKETEGHRGIIHGRSIHRVACRLSLIDDENGLKKITKSNNRAIVSWLYSIIFDSIWIEP